MSTALAAKTDALPWSGSARQINQAMQGSFIRQCDDDELTALVKGWMREALTIMGQGKSMTDKEAFAIQKETVMMFRAECRDLSISEVQYLVQKGARGSYETEEKAYSLRALCSWIRAYREEKRKALEEIKNKPQVEQRSSVQLTDAEKLTHLERFYQSWMNLQEGQILGGYSTSFGYAWDLELLRFNKDRRKEFADRAVEKMTAEFRAMKASKNTFQAGADGLRMLSHVDTTKRDIHGQVKAEAAKIALIEWFEHLKEMESSPSKQMQEQ